MNSIGDKQNKFNKEVKSMVSTNVKDFAEEIVKSAAERSLTVEEFRSAVFTAKLIVNQTVVSKDSVVRFNYK